MAGHIETIRERLKTAHGDANDGALWGACDATIDQFIGDVMVGLVAAGWRLLSPEAVTVTINLNQAGRSITFAARNSIGGAP